ncbi:1287_t:CDS:2, partial [Ambispora gerdemannii]
MTNLSASKIHDHPTLNLEKKSGERDTHAKNSDDHKAGISFSYALKMMVSQSPPTLPPAPTIEMAPTIGGENNSSIKKRPSQKRTQNCVIRRPRISARLLAKLTNEEETNDVVDGNLEPKTTGIHEHEDDDVVVRLEEILMKSWEPNVETIVFYEKSSEKKNAYVDCNQKNNSVRISDNATAKNLCRPKLAGKQRRRRGYDYQTICMPGSPMGMVQRMSTMDITHLGPTR